MLLSREKLISMAADTQFEVTQHEITSLDRCNLCGAPRSAHDVDWTCSPGIAVRNAQIIAAVTTAGLLAIGGVVILAVTSTTGTSPGSLGAAIVLGALAVLICAMYITHRRHPGRDR
jgi:hypothetical protein